MSNFLNTYSFTGDFNNRDVVKSFVIIVKENWIKEKVHSATNFFGLLTTTQPTNREYQLSLSQDSIKSIKEKHTQKGGE